MALWSTFVSGVVWIMNTFGPTLWNQAVQDGSQLVYSQAQRCVVKFHDIDFVWYTDAGF